MSDIHVLPLNDLREHDDKTRDFWCGPRLVMGDPDDDANDSVIVVHNSADGRELVERHGVN